MDRPNYRSWRNLPNTSRIQAEYESQGYEVRRIGTSVIQLMLQDGTVDIWWEHGVFWQEIRENEK